MRFSAVVLIVPEEDENPAVRILKEAGATGISAVVAYGDAVVHNSGDVYAGSIYGDAIGIYAYSVAGDAGVQNSGAISAVSYYGLADGIFASGEDVEVANSGAIETYGYAWSAGIEAQGSDSVAVSNSGDISASSSGPAGPRGSRRADLARSRSSTTTRAHC